MTISRELVVALEDVLSAVSLRCDRCNTLVTLDLSDPTKASEKGHFVPTECAVCRAKFDSSWQHVDSLRTAYKALAGFGDRITFRVRLPG